MRSPCTLRTSASLPVQLKSCLTLNDHRAGNPLLAVIDLFSNSPWQLLNHQTHWHTHNPDHDISKKLVGNEMATALIESKHESNKRASTNILLKWTSLASLANPTLSLAPQARTLGV